MRDGSRASSCFIFPDTQKTLMGPVDVLIFGKCADVATRIAGDRVVLTMPHSES